ncbi:MAG TPA: hypothetical protein VMA36_12660 [Candidatus Limnocylindria bacterium]|jgi:hypothetical protein|nr:hypothetical protein [Candidatus Limnocylindria bacterium]
MHWRPRVAWASLAVLTVLAASLLTHWVTSVHPNVEPTVRVVFDEQPPVVLRVGNVAPAELKAARYRIPAILFAAEDTVVFIVGPPTRSVAFENLDPRDVTCRVDERAFTSESFMSIAQKAQRDRITVLPVSATEQGGVRIAVPDALHAAIAATRNGQGAIVCTFARPPVAAPTFTERAVTVMARNGAGAVVVDVSVLENVENLSFSGGIIVPFAGERVRLLAGADDVLSLAWVNVAAQEQRDVVLVLVGGLAAIAAAMAIEAVRPFIER